MAWLVNNKSKINDKVWQNLLLTNFTILSRHINGEFIY